MSIGRTFAAGTIEGEMEPIETCNLEEALAYVLAAHGQPRLANATQIRAYAKYLEECRIRWEALRIRRMRRTTGVVFVLLLPGSSAIVMIPRPGEFGIEYADQRAVTRAGLDRLKGRNLHFGQALLESGSGADREILEEAGFHYLATLLYLQRDVARPAFDAPRPDEAEWISFNDDTHPRFAHTLLETYEDSLDCPELTGLRPIEDVIASHQAAGAFDPTLWELARIEGENAGCMLLSRVSQVPAIEVVYTGVVPRWRGRGVGSLLVRRALQHCRDTGVRVLTLVVDQRNDPARRLYARFGLQTMVTREALLYRGWDGSRP